MSPRIGLAVTSALVLGMLAVGCGGGGASPTTAPAAPTTSAAAPTKAPAAPTTAGGATGDAAAGQAVFTQNCNGCHPGGDRGTGPALKGRNLPADRITRQVRNGGGGMPAFSSSQISDQQLANLVAYVQSLK